jgi:hypothetical protein
MPRSPGAGKGAKEPSLVKKKAIYDGATDLNKKLADFSKSLKSAKASARDDDERWLLDLRIRVVDNLADQIATNCIYPPFGFGFLHRPCDRTHKR